MRLRAFLACCLLFVYACGANPKPTPRDVMEPIPAEDVPLIYPPCCPPEKKGDPKCVQIFDRCWLIPVATPQPAARNESQFVTVICSQLNGCRTLIK